MDKKSFRMSFGAGQFENHLFGLVINIPSWWHQIQWNAEDLSTMARTGMSARHQGLSQA